MKKSLSKITWFALWCAIFIHHGVAQTTSQPSEAPESATLPPATLNAGAGPTVPVCYGQGRIEGVPPLGLRTNAANGQGLCSTKAPGAALGTIGSSASQLAPATRSLDWGLKTPSFDLTWGKNEIKIPSFTIFDQHVNSAWDGRAYGDVYRSTQLGPITWIDTKPGGVLVSYEEEVRRAFANRAQRKDEGTNSVANSNRTQSP